MTTLEKQCFKCLERKPLEAFYKHKMMADGRLNKCVACTKADVTAHRAANLDRVRAYDRERGLSTQAVARRLAYFETNNGKDAKARAGKAWDQRNKQKKAAHNAVSRAVMVGKLDRWPVCAVPECDCKDVEANHPDYSMPLAVTWLCVTHHNELHRMARRAK